MPAPNPKTYHLSASSVSAFKMCPMKFRLAYREGIRRATDTESQRVGTAWHGMHEAFANELAHARKVCAEIKAENPGPEHVVADPEEVGSAYGLQAAVAYLDQRYEKVPTYLTATEWAIEREILLQSFVAYQWYWQNDPIEYLASEVPFSLPIYEPRTGLPLRKEDVVKVGKIDHIIKWQSAVCAHERKSTTRSIDHDSDYWDIARKDTQVSQYALAFRDMRYQGSNGTWLRHAESETLIFLGDVPRFGNTLYDVWRKPAIRPATLTQGETAEFLKTGDYCGRKFKAMLNPVAAIDPLPASTHVIVDGEVTEIIPGKKGFAIRETVAMFGARLLQTLCEKPDRHFVRREIVRTEADLAQFKQSLFVIYQAMKAFAAGNLWYENEKQCRATVPCDFIPICYGPGATAVCDGKTTPEGFKRIFVDLTHEGKSLEVEQ